MKIKKPKLSNIIFVAIVVLLIVPQTRQPIQVFLHKGLALFSPSTVSEEDRTLVNHFNWQLQSLDGRDYNFSQVEGKVSFVNIWATWCPPCIAEMPAIQALYDDYKDKIEILLVSEENPKVIQNYLNKNNYTFTIYRPVSKMPETLETSSIPRTFIINKKGEIVVDKSGAANWNSEKVRNLLNSLLAE